MTSTAFISGTTIQSDWLNDVNTATYNASSAISGASTRSQLSKNSDTVSITDFGAVSGTDSTTAIQSALNLGGGVYVPAGTYDYSTLTLVDNNKVWGPGTLRRKTTAGISTGEKYCIDATNADNWTLETTLDGNKAGQSGSAGFKVSGLLIRGSTNFFISNSVFKNWHEDAIEITCATQGTPTNSYTPPADPADIIYKGIIVGNLFMDCGRNVDDGSGVSTSHCIQIGSTVAGVVVSNNVFWNCIGGVQAAAYNRHLAIIGNSGYVDSSTIIYAADFIDVEQLSRHCTVVGNVCSGYNIGYNIESPVGIVVANNYAQDVKYGISAFASNISATSVDFAEAVIANNRIKCRGTTSGTFGIRAVKSSGNNSYNIVVTGNNVENGQNGIQVSGVTGGSVVGNYVKSSTTGFNLDNNVKLLVSTNHANSCSAEGFYFGTSNSGVTVSANKSVGNALGCDVAATQSDLRIYDNDWDGSNSTYDFRIATYATNNIKHDNNRFTTHSGTIKSLSGASMSVLYVGPTSYLNNGGATTVTAITGGRIGEAFRFIASNGNTTLQHGTNIFLRSHANLALAANDAITLATDDGTHWYEC